jgi:hypothetical protein
MREWSREEHHLFPAEFRAVVRQLVRGHYSAASMLSTLPMDVLELVIAHLARDPYSFAAIPVLPNVDGFCQCQTENNTLL